MNGFWPFESIRDEPPVIIKSIFTKAEDMIALVTHQTKGTFKEVGHFTHLLIDSSLSLKNVVLCIWIFFIVLIIIGTCLDRLRKNRRRLAQQSRSNHTLEEDGKEKKDEPPSTPTQIKRTRSEILSDASMSPAQQRWEIFRVNLGKAKEMASRERIQIWIRNLLEAAGRPNHEREFFMHKNKFQRVFDWNIEHAISDEKLQEGLREDEAKDIDYFLIKMTLTNEVTMNVRSWEVKRSFRELADLHEKLNYIPTLKSKQFPHTSIVPFVNFYTDKETLQMIKDYLSCAFLEYPLPFALKHCFQMEKHIREDRLESLQSLHVENVELANSRYDQLVQIMSLLAILAISALCGLFRNYGLGAFRFMYLWLWDSFIYYRTLLGASFVVLACWSYFHWVLGWIASYLLTQTEGGAMHFTIDWISFRLGADESEIILSGFHFHNTRVFKETFPDTPYFIELNRACVRFSLESLFGLLFYKTPLVVYALEVEGLTIRILKMDDEIAESRRSPTLNYLSCLGEAGEEIESHDKRRSVVVEVGKLGMGMTKQTMKTTNHVLAGLALSPYYAYKFLFRRKLNKRINKVYHKVDEKPSIEEKTSLDNKLTAEGMSMTPFRSPDSYGAENPQNESKNLENSPCAELESGTPALTPFTPHVHHDNDDGNEGDDEDEGLVGDDRKLANAMADQKDQRNVRKMMTTQNRLDAFTTWNSFTSDSSKKKKKAEKKLKKAKEKKSKKGTAELVENSDSSSTDSSDSSDVEIGYHKEKCIKLTEDYMMRVNRVSVRDINVFASDILAASHQGTSASCIKIDIMDLEKSKLRKCKSIDDIVWKTVGVIRNKVLAKNKLAILAMMRDAAVTQTIDVSKDMTISSFNAVMEGVANYSPHRTYSRLAKSAQSLVSRPISIPREPDPVVTELSLTHVYVQICSITEFKFLCGTPIKWAAVSVYLQEEDPEATKLKAAEKANQAVKRDAASKEPAVQKEEHDSDDGIVYKTIGMQKTFRRKLQSEKLLKIVFDERKKIKISNLKYSRILLTSYLTGLVKKKEKVCKLKIPLTNSKLVGIRHVIVNREKMFSNDYFAKYQGHESRVPHPERKKCAEGFLQFGIGVF
jgi:hypothetical protein